VRSSCAGQGTCGPVGGGDGGPGAPPPQDGPPGALYVVQKSVIVGAASPEQIVFSLPPAAAVDVFIQYRNPTTGSTTDPEGSSRFSIYATQKLLSYRIDRNDADVVSATNRRILAVRDLPVDRYEVKVDGVNLVDSGGAFYDVVAIGWGEEPTGIGPLPLSQWMDTSALPEIGRSIGLPFMAADQGGATVVLVKAGDSTVHAIGSTRFADLNTLPVSQFLSAPPTRSNTNLGPLMSDADGNLKVVVSSGASGTVFPASSALADNDPNPTTTRVGANLLLYDGATWDLARSGVITAATPAGWLNELAGGVYNSAAPTLTNGQAITLQLDVNGNAKSREQYQPVFEDNTNGVAAVQARPIVSATYAWSVIFSTALAAKLIIKASAGKIRHIEGRIDSTASTATYYVQLWNLTDVPGDATAVSSTNARMAPFKIQHTSGTDDYFEIDFSDPGVAADTGLTLGLSTTEFTKTAAGSFLSATVEFI
jgi:hypothetical protein